MICNKEKKIVWKKQVEARGSSWKVKCVTVSENDLLVLGSNSDEEASQLFICDLGSLEWSTTALCGEGLGNCDYYYPTISEENEGMFVFWSSKEKGIYAHLTDNFESEENILCRDEKVLLLDSNTSDQDMILCLNKDEIVMEVPKTLLLVEEDNSFFESFERSDFAISFLSFAEGMQWSRILIGSDQSPKARKDYTCTMIDHKIYVFGGISDCGTICNDMHILDLVELKWTKCIFNAEEDKPTARFGHSATALDSEYILIFGGKGYEKKYNDLYLFNISSEEWSLLEIDDAPAPRSYHSFVRLNEFIILFGGEGDDLLLNDLFLLDIEESRWIKIESSDLTPPPRKKHFSGLFFEQNSIVFFGGENDSENLFDIYTMHLEEIESSEIEFVETSPKLEDEGIEINYEGIDTESSQDGYNSTSPEKVELDDNTSIPSQDSFSEVHIKDIIFEEEQAYQPLQYDEMTQTSINGEEILDMISDANEFKMHSDGNDLIIDFDSHEFFVLEENQQERLQSQTSDEKDVLEVIFRTISLGNQTISLFTLLKLCRNCRIIENWLSYDSILESVSSILQQTELNGDEQIDCFLFRKITADISQKRNKKFTIQDRTFNHLQLIEGLLKPYYKTMNQLDDMLIEILSPTVLLLFDSRKAQLQELFSVYSCLNQNTLLPDTKEVMKSNRTISLAEFISFAETFDITPHKISRISLQKTIFYNSLPPEGSKSFKESKSKGLNYPQFIESLGRLAIHIYSQRPFSNFLKTSKEKLEVFFNHLGLQDTTKFKDFLKKAGIGGLSFSPNKNSYPIKPPKAIPKTKNEQLPVENKKIITDEMRRKYVEMMQNKHLLKDELEKVFMYYCSFGNRMNLDLMSSSKFKMFIRDTNIYMYGFKQEEADLIFVKVLSNTKKKSNSSQKLSFPQFVECVKEIASKLRKDLSSTKAFAQFLLIDVLPNAHRLGGQKVDNVVYDESLHTMLEKHRKNLQKMFIFYCNSETGNSHKITKDTMTNNNLFKLCTDFEIIPLVSKKEVYRIFRAYSSNELSYQNFENCLLEIVELAYCKHPYNSKYPTLSDKIGALFQKMELEDWNLTRKRLEKIGRNSTISINSIPISIKTQSLRKTETVEGSFPKEEELDKLLQSIFVNVSSSGNYLSMEDFIFFLKDCNILEKRLTTRDAQQVFHEISSTGPMIFELFCESLGVIACKMFPEMKNSTDSLKILILDFIWPYGSSNYYLASKDIQ